MTRKDYVLIANTINKELTAFKEMKVHPTHQMSLLVNSLADALAKDNDRFDYARFVEATGVK